MVSVDVKHDVNLLTVWGISFKLQAKTTLSLPSIPLHPALQVQAHTPVSLENHHQGSQHAVQAHRDLVSSWVRNRVNSVVRKLVTGTTRNLVKGTMVSKSVNQDSVSLGWRCTEVKALQG